MGALQREFQINFKFYGISIFSVEIISHEIVNFKNAELNEFEVIIFFSSMTLHLTILNFHSWMSGTKICQYELLFIRYDRTHV